MRVLFVVTGLGTGGAEMQLYRLLGGLGSSGLHAGVFVLGHHTALADDMRALGVPLQCGGLVGARDLPRALVRLTRFAKDFRPDIVQGWMYHGNVAAMLASRLCATGARLSWGIRQSLYDLAAEKPMTRRVIRGSAWMSRKPDAIVYNSYTARAQHEANGFCSVRARVIDNGFDVDHFRPDPEARTAVRRMLGLPVESRLVGLVARYHPMKNHRLFLEAAALLARARPDVHFLLVGKAVSPENPDLAPGLAAPALVGRVHCLGERKDVAWLTAALDLATSSSAWGEAFPNALGEAMSSGIPCVTTDVGDAARIVGESGIVVPVGNPGAMADAWATLLADEELRVKMGQRARERISRFFSLQAMVRGYQDLWETLQCVKT